MAKISTKTFNPMAGVSIPGWALESYQSTSSDLDSVVNSLTNAYNQQQEREANMAFDVARLNQQESQFSEQMEFSKQKDAKDRAFADRQARRQRDENRYKMSLEEDKIVDAARRERYDRGVDSLNVLMKDATPADWETSETMLDNFNTQGLGDLENLKDVYRARFVTKGKEDYTDRRNITASLMYRGDTYENLDDESKSKVDTYARQTYDPSSKDNWANHMIEAYMPRMSPIARERYKVELAGYKEAMKTIFLPGMSSDERATAMKSITEGMDDVVSRATSSLEIPPGEGADNTQSNYNQQAFIPPSDTPEGSPIQVKTADYGTVTIRNDDYTVENGVKMYNATKADGSEVTLFPEEFDIPAGIKGWSEAPKKEASDYLDDIMYGPKSLATIGRYATRGINEGSGVSIKDVINKLPSLEDAGQAVSEVDAILASVLSPVLGFDAREEDIRLASDVGSQFLEAGGRASDFAAQSIKEGISKHPMVRGGKALIDFETNLANSAIQYFPNLLNDREEEMLAQDPKVLEMFGQGVPIADAISQRRAEIKEGQGGVFYSGVGADEKYMTKERLFDGNLFRGSISDEGLAKLPKKMINPEWVEKKALQFSSDIDKEVAGLSDDLSGYSDIRKDYLALDKSEQKRGGEKVVAYKTAGRMISDKSSRLSDIKKELISYRNDIKKVEKYKSKGAYNVSSKNVDMLLKRVNQIQKRMKAARRKPELEKKVSESMKTMKRKQDELEKLLMNYNKSKKRSLDDPYTDFFGTPIPTMY